MLSASFDRERRALIGSAQARRLLLLHSAFLLPARRYADTFPPISRDLPARIGEARAPQFHSEEAHIVRKPPGNATPLDLGHYLAK